MGRYKVVYEDLEGKCKREYIIEYSNEKEREEKQNEAFKDWIKECGGGSYNVKVTSA